MTMRQKKFSKSAEDAIYLILYLYHLQLVQGLEPFADGSFIEPLLVMDEVAFCRNGSIGFTTNI